ncbi:MAG: hypothetical protein M1818_008345 [Claussenomyces sp. TS43310]|nr:MAG: hypothetical protein M1818_008345 [Claussenomyces sp. TS43310]
MADTPTRALPIDSREQPILDALFAIQADLTMLKQDRSTYVKSSDVMALYDRTVAQVQALNEVRSEHPRQENRGEDTWLSHGKAASSDNQAVDRVMEGCFQLLSLFFMTIGKNNEAPAAYALTSTIKRLLDHLTEAALYSAKDLDHIAHTLRNLREIISNADGKYAPKLVTLLSNRANVCSELCYGLQQQLQRLDPSLADINERLISILRCISLKNTKAKFSATELINFQQQVREIDAQRVDGHFVNEQKEPLAGDAEITDLLQRILLWCDIVLERKGVFPEPFRATYDKLVSIRNDLERLSLTQAWSLRETDLYDFQRQLDRIDESRVNGNFLDTEGNAADLFVQRTFLYLIRRSYGYIYYLMVSSEPVSEALLPIYNQLLTLRRCLIEVRESGGVSSPRELYPYSMKLNSLDNMKIDGKFMVGGEIPEGQGSVADLLAECFELNYELRVAAETDDDK